MLSGGGRKAATGKPRCRLREGAKGVLAARIGRGRRVDPLAVVPGGARGKATRADVGMGREIPLQLGTVGVAVGPRYGGWA